MKGWMLGVLMLVVGVAQAASPVDELLACMQATVPTTLRAQQVELETRSANGEVRELLKGTLYARRAETDEGLRTRATLQVQGPEYLVGAAYLVVQSTDFLRDGVYVYLPSVRRVRQVTGTFADGALLGTSFSYFDFKQLTGAFGGAEMRIEGHDEIDGRAVRLMSFTPSGDDRTDYTHVRTWVDRETCLPLRAEFYEGDRLRKRLRAPVTALREDKGHAYLSAATMEDLRDGRVTEFRSVGVQTDADLSAALFSPEAFYRAP